MEILTPRYVAAATPAAALNTVYESSSVLRPTPNANVAGLPEYCSRQRVLDDGACRFSPLHDFFTSAVRRVE